MDIQQSADSHFHITNTGFLYGYDIGATSFVLDTLLRGSSDTWWDDFRHYKVAQGLLVGAVSFGALLGSHIVLFHLASILGRRMELRIAASLYFLGTLLNVLSGTLLQSLSVGWMVLLLGRLLFGVGVGFVMHAAPNYMAEMSPTSIRGAVVTAKETLIVFGIVCGYATGDVLTSHTDDWTQLYLICCVMSIPMWVLTYVIPRSKRWLLMHGMRDEAKQAMQFIYDDDVTEHFNRLAATIAHNSYHKQHSTPAANGGCADLWNSRLFTKPIRPALVAALGLVFMQQLSGQPSVISYATVIFDAAGWSGHASVVTAVLMMCVSTTTVLLVDRVGRKRMLSLCCIVLLLALLVLSFSLWGWYNGAGHSLGPVEKTLVLISMFVYIGGYQLGFGPITYLVVSEVFPQDVRGSATALCIELNYLMNFSVQFALPLIQDQIGWSSTFLVFASAMLVALFFVRSCLPETTGLSLEEIEQQLMQKRETDVATEATERSPLLDDRIERIEASRGLV